MKYVKKIRQLVFATHDANIVINGDAELIVNVNTNDGAFGEITPLLLKALRVAKELWKFLKVEKRPLIRVVESMVTLLHNNMTKP